MPKNPWAPDESDYVIFVERAFIAGDLICGVGYGIQLCMYSYCARYLWSQRETRRNALFTLAYITAIFIIETMFVGVQARTIQICYVDNRNYPGGPWQYFLATQNLPENAMFYALLFLITFLCDCLVLWRCWIIWRAVGKRAAYLACAFPTLMLVASFVMGVLWTVQSSRPGLSAYSALPMEYGTSYYAISLSINIVLSLLIVTRLFQYKRTVARTMTSEHAQQYLSLATVLVESAALYSLFALMFLITYATSIPANQIVFGATSATQQISMYMIIYRLADGKAWKSTTLDVTALTTMQFEDRAFTVKSRFDAATITSGVDFAADPDPDPEPPRTASTETATHVWTPSEPEWAITIEKHGTSMV